MGTSLIDEQRQILLETLRRTVGDSWMILVVDEGSRKLINNVAKEDDILNLNITAIEQLEQPREQNSYTDAVYLLSPLPRTVECLKADLHRKRYRKAILRWTSALPGYLHDEILRSELRRVQIVDSLSLDIDFSPRESHLVTFDQPWSFLTLFHRECDGLVKAHIDGLVKKIVSICVSLGEYPLIRYYRPRTNHAAQPLCNHLAKFLSEAIDSYARHNQNTFPRPVQNRPRAVVFITDRSMDLMSPLVHEFTYQAMAMDLLPIRDEGKLMYTNVIRRGQRDQEEKDVELGEKDKIWVANRHMHMKDLLDKIVSDFRKFQADNPQYAESDDNGPASVNTIKDMLAGLPQFQEGKEAFSLHLDLAEKLVKIFQERKLLDLASVEQSLATGLDEDYKKPKNLADQLVRLLDDDSVIHEDRLRLLMMYTIYRYGILPGDKKKLEQHGQLSPMDGETIYNMEQLGARVEKPLKDNTPSPAPLFPPKIPVNPQNEEVSLSRYEPNLRHMLETYCNGTLDTHLFPPVKPHLEDANSSANISQSSLRSTASKPTWARNPTRSNEPRQRIVVFMAGGATYAEARACYEISHQYQKEVFLTTSHMHTPRTFLRQVGLLSSGRKMLDLPEDQPLPRLPAWVHEKDPALRPAQQQPSIPKQAASGRPPDRARPPTEAMGRMNINSPTQNGHRPIPLNAPGTAPAISSGAEGRLKKEKKEKKHFGVFGKKH
jgi:syntaxin-binding protein 1